MRNLPGILSLSLFFVERTILSVTFASLSSCSSKGFLKVRSSGLAGEAGLLLNPCRGKADLPLLLLLISVQPKSAGSEPDHGPVEQRTLFPEVTRSRTVFSFAIITLIKDS